MREIWACPRRAERNIEVHYVFGTLDPIRLKIAMLNWDGGMTSTCIFVNYCMLNNRMQWIPTEQRRVTDMSKMRTKSPIERGNNVKLCKERLFHSLLIEPQTS